MFNKNNNKMHTYFTYSRYKVGKQVTSARFTALLNNCSTLKLSSPCLIKKKKPKCLSSYPVYGARIRVFIFRST